MEQQEERGDRDIQERKSEWVAPPPCLSSLAMNTTTTTTFVDIQFHNGYPTADREDRKRARVEKILQGM